MKLHELAQPTSATSLGLRGLAEALERHLNARFPRLAGHDDNTHLYGIYRISSRVKSYTSIVRKQLREAKRFPDPGELADVSQLTAWMSDIIGLRIVVLSQRHKLVVQRAIDRLCTFATFAGVSLRPHGGAIRTTAAGNAYPRWKYFNPPTAYLSSAPYYVRRVEDTLDNMLESLPQQPSPQRRLRVDATLDSLTAITHDSPFHIKHKLTGYATLQTTLVSPMPVLAANGSETQVPHSVVFEVQIRTILEDAWAEPEHALSYKASLDEDTSNLMRNLGAHLQTADDLLQQVVDRWAAVYRPRHSAPYAHMSRNYRRRYHNDSSLRAEAYEPFKRDYEKLYRLAQSGRYGEAYNHVQRMLDKYELDSDRHLQGYGLDLALERALICLYCREPHMLVDGLAICSAIAPDVSFLSAGSMRAIMSRHNKASARTPNAPSTAQAFWARFRGSELAAAIAEARLAESPKSNGRLTACLRDLECIKRVVDDLITRWPTYAQDVRRRNESSGLHEDLVLWMSRLCRKIGRAHEKCGNATRASRSYGEAIEHARRIIARGSGGHDAGVEQLVTFARNGAAYCSYLQAPFASRDERLRLLWRARRHLARLGGRFEQVIDAVENGDKPPQVTYAFNDRELMIADTIASVYEELGRIQKGTRRSRNWRIGARALLHQVYEGLIQIELRGEVGRDEEFFRNVEQRVMRPHADADLV